MADLTDPMTDTPKVTGAPEQSVSVKLSDEERDILEIGLRKLQAGAINNVTPRDYAIQRAAVVLVFESILSQRLVSVPSGDLVCAAIAADTVLG